MKTYLLAGLISSAAGLLTFLIIHHYWVMPIWFVLPLGLVIAGLGGLAVGRMYGVLQPHLPPRPWSSLAVFVLATVILAPAIALSAVRSPVFDVVTGTLLPGLTVPVVVRRFIVELLVPSVLMGGLTGWLIGRSRRAVVATSLAGLIFALGPGHNIPLLAGTHGIPKGTAILLVPTLVSAIVLVEIDALLRVRSHAATRKDGSDPQSSWRL